LKLAFGRGAQDTSFSGTIGAISLLCRAAVEAIELSIEQITNASPERCWYTTVLEPRTSR
jgi:hypothetical protein